MNQAMETTTVLRAKALRGDADAAFRKGYRYAVGRARGTQADWREAVRWWKLAASARDGNPRAWFYLGTCFDNGMGVRKSVVEAMRWYRRAADAGVPEAQYNLAFGYRDGAGVRQDAKRAVRYYRMAATQGYPDAQRDLGVRYHEGRGV